MFAIVAIIWHKTQLVVIKQQLVNISDRWENLFHLS